MQRDAAIVVRLRARVVVLAVHPPRDAVVRLGLRVRDVLDLSGERLELLDGLRELGRVVDVEALGAPHEILELLPAPVRARVGGVRGGAYLRGGCWFNSIYPDPTCAV